MARGGSAGSSESWHPAANKETFRDLLVFEERLKQNAERLARARRKYEAFLACVVVLIGYFGYYVWIRPSIYTLIHYLNVTLLLISTVTLVLFFATGIYSEKITYAHKFVPQANRALRPFNMYLNTRSRFFWARKYPQPSPASPQPLSRSPSTSSTKSSIGAKSPPASPRLRPSVAPIPPALNPRGELIFSTRVAAAFREGYERYRSEWEKRRLSNKAAHQGPPSLWTSWLYAITGRRPPPPPPPPRHHSPNSSLAPPSRTGSPAPTTADSKPSISSGDGSTREKKRHARPRATSSTTSSRNVSPKRTSGGKSPSPPASRPSSPAGLNSKPRRQRSLSNVSNASSVENHPPGQTTRRQANASTSSTSSLDEATIKPSATGLGIGRARAESFSQVLDELQEEGEQQRVLL